MPKKYQPMTIEKFFSLSKPNENGCLIWQANISSTGYGRFWNQTERKWVPAHRWIHESLCGPIDKSLVVDHKCNNRSCVNPEHLQAISNIENVLSGNSPAALNGTKHKCMNGHDFNMKNTYIDPKGKRRKCRICSNDREKRKRSPSLPASV